MSDTTPTGAPHSYDQIQQFAKALAWFMEHNCQSMCLDDEDDRDSVAEDIATWLLGSKREADLNVNFDLPKANWKNEFNIVDERFDPPRHIARFTLFKRDGMSQDEFMARQNDMYVLMGKAILASTAHKALLKGIGVDITIIEPEPGAPLLPAV